MESLFPYAIILAIFGYYTYQRIFNNVKKVKMQPQAEQAQISIALSLAEDTRSEEGMLPATAEMIERLHAKGICLERPLTMDEATHLLDLFSPPSGRQIDILKHFRLPYSRGMSKTLANFHIRDIFRDPAKVESWNRRPPTTRIKQALLFMNGQMINGLTYVEAQSRLTQMGMERPMKYQTWKRMERRYFEVNDAELLKKYNARKITWKHYFEVYESLLANGLVEDEIDAEAILKRARFQAEKAADPAAADSQSPVNKKSQRPPLIPAA